MLLALKRKQWKTFTIVVLILLLLVECVHHVLMQTRLPKHDVQVIAELAQVSRQTASPPTVMGVVATSIPVSNKASTDFRRHEKETKDNTRISDNNTKEPQIQKITTTGSLATAENDVARPFQTQEEAASTSSERKASRTISIYVGPHKTGTTFFQNSFCCNPKVTTATLYALDNLVYLGTCPYPCWKKNDRNLIPNANKVIYDNPKFYEQLKKAKIDGKNAFMVYEDIGGYWTSKQANTFAQRLRDAGWEIKVIFGYRRFFEWLFSWYNQKEKQGLKKGWPDPSANQTMKYNVRPFEESHAAPILQKSKRTKEHHFAFHYKMMQDAFGKDHVSILDIHQNFTGAPSSLGDPMLEHFVCERLPNASHTCTAVRNGLLNLEMTANPSFPLEPDALAWHAKMSGLYNGQMPRRKVMRAVAMFLQSRQSSSQPMELPYSCWSDKRAEELLSLSLEVERNFFLQVGLPVPGESEHRVAFEKFVERKKLCTLNVTVALQNPEWTQFFAELSKI